MNYFITGSSGLIGSHVLFELLNNIHKEKSGSRIYLLVRKNEYDSSESRIRSVIFNEEAPAFVKKLPLEKLMKQIKCIDSDLTNPELPKILGKIKSKNLRVIHIAASTNLMQGPIAEKDVYENNFLGTLNLLHSLKSLSVSRFSFVSTAFSCGVQDDLEIIGNDYLEYQSFSFRNPYEEHKNQIEKILSEYCSKIGMDLQILRPAVVCGRLMDIPLYITTKFDVFYGWAKFFYMRKDSIGSQKIRIAINTSGTQNIVPADFVSKVITKAIHLQTIKQMNITSKNPPLHKEYLAKILDEIGIPNYEFVSSVPEDLSLCETLYYKSVGRVFNPYLCNKNLVFDTRELSEKFSEFQFNDVNQNFGKLIQYAISKRFEESNSEIRKPAKSKIINLPPSFQNYEIQKQA